MGGRVAAAVAVGVAMAVAARAEIAAHRVRELPGFGEVQGRQWSGYIEVPVPGQNTSAFVHYWLVENSEGAADAPVVSWFQGGPGGSSMIGLFTENGPFFLSDASFGREDGELEVFANPHSWHTAPANMLYVEHPAPTGFSRCAPGPCRWDDTSQAVVSYGFMERFFAAYPEFATQPFFMTGESYAGVLVPSLAHEILAHRTKANRARAPWSLRGFALGNACPGNRVFTCTPYSGWIGTRVAVDFRYFHGMISDKRYAEIQQACAGQWDTYEAPASARCRSLLEDPVRPVMSQAGDTYHMGGGYFLYDTCKQDLGAIDPSTHKRREVHPEEILLAERAERALGARSSSSSSSSSSSPSAPPPNSGEYACGQERGALAYLNRPEVQRALHVEPTAFGFQTSLHYAFTSHSLVDLYRDELAEELDILQYSGDADPCVPYIGTQKWVDSLELDTVRDWSPWRSPADPHQPAGYLSVMHSRNKAHSFAFATVRDAGHMAPRYKPEPTLHLLRSFLGGWHNAKL